MRLAIIVLLFISTQVVGQEVNGLRFIENKGQWDSDIDFQALVPGGRVGVSPNGFSIVVLNLEEMEHRHMASHGEPLAVNEFDGGISDDGIDGHYFKINFVGANSNVKPIATASLQGHHNYFLGSDSCRWASHAKAYGSILYQNVYEGVDFKVSSVGQDLKYDFIVRPGADPSQIKIEYAGLEALELSGFNLALKTSVRTLIDQRPVSYQSNQNISTEYLLNDNVVSFYFANGYDECEELLIDPLLIFSTYSGSTADNWGSTATPGEHGTLYSAGVTTQSLGGFFPATPGAFQTTNRGSFDMGIIKYDSAGTQFLYATYLGGEHNDSPQSLVVDRASGDLIVLGISSSPNYPTSINAFDNSFNLGTPVSNRVLNTTDLWDIVLTRLSSDGGTLKGSTFLGGSGNDGLNHPKQSGGALVVNYGDEMRGDVITDDAGYVYISSVTSSGDFPIINGFDDTFNGGITDGLVVKLAPDLSSIVWSTYVGGSGFDASYSIKFDVDQNVIVAGGTTSADFPVTPGVYQNSFNGIVDGWIARIASDGSSIIDGTFTGTSSFDQVYFVDLNADGDIFVYGQTAGQMPVTSGVYRNANSGQFLQKFSPDLSILKLSTVFGSGSTGGLVIPNISPTAFLVNDCDNIYMAGWGGFVNSSSGTGYWPSSTHGMPVTSDAYQKTTSGSDFYFIVLNGDATELVYSTFLGGNSSKTHVDGGTSRFDKYGIVYHSVCSGCTFGNINNTASSDFPTSPNAKSRLNRSQNCNNAAFKFDLSSLRALFDTNNTAFTAPGFNNVCYPDSIVFENFSTGGKTITWDFDDGTIVTQQNTDPRFVIHQYKQPGQYKVKLKIMDLSTCSQTDSTFKIINYFKENITVGPDAMVCEGSPFQLTASGGIDYKWTSSDGSFSSNEQFPVVQPTEEISYFVTVTDVNGCSRSDTLSLGIIRNVHAAFQTYNLDLSKSDFNDVCYPEALQFKNLSRYGTWFVWDFGDGTTPLQMSDSVAVVHQYHEPGTYTVKLRALNPQTCNQDDIATKIIRYYKDNIQVGDDGEICEGEQFQLKATGGNTYAWVSEDRQFISSNASPLVQPGTSTKYFITVTDANNCVRKDTVQVTVRDSVRVDWRYRLEGTCVDRPAVFVQNLTPDQTDVTFRFDFGDGQSTTNREATHVYESDGLYLVRLISETDYCVFEESVQLPVYTVSVPNVFTPEGSPGYNDVFEVGFGPELISPSDAGLPVHLIVVDRWGKKVFESHNYQNDWSGSYLVSGVYYFQLRVGDLATCKNWVHIVK